MFSPRRDTMHLHNKTTFTVVLCLALSLLLSVSAFAQPQNPQGQSQPGQAVQPTPLPSDIDASDPALPVWMRPKTAPPTTSSNANANNPRTAKNTNAPSASD